MHCHINIQKLKFDRINMFEGNDVNKTNVVTQVYSLQLLLLFKSKF